jgi:hypothetical protein
MIGFFIGYLTIREVKRVSVHCQTLKRLDAVRERSWMTESVFAYDKGSAPTDSVKPSNGRTPFGSGHG